MAYSFYRVTRTLHEDPTVPTEKYHLYYLLLFILRSYGTSTSIAARQQNRLLLSFERIESAKERQKKYHNHVGNIDNYNWDAEKCLEKVHVIYILCILDRQSDRVTPS